jgi:hypothetical protein
MFAYAIAPIYWWPGWLSEGDFKKQLTAVFTTRDAACALFQYEERLKVAHDLGQKVGWKGDMREGPYIAGLPPSDSGGGGDYMIAWKQDNNGDTFIVSPYRIPWLEQGKWVEG